MKLLMGVLLLGLGLILISVLIALPIAYMEVSVFNKMENTEYSLKEWFWCRRAIMLRHAIRGEP